MKDWTICIYILMPEVKNRTNAKIIEIIMATLTFLYCFAFMFFNMTIFILSIYLLHLNISLNTIASILDCKIPTRIMAPSIINKNMELNRTICKAYCPSSTAKGIQQQLTTPQQTNMHAINNAQKVMPKVAMWMTRILTMSKVRLYGFIVQDKGQVWILWMWEYIRHDVNMVINRNRRRRLGLGWGRCQYSRRVSIQQYKNYLSKQQMNVLMRVVSSQYLAKPTFTANYLINYTFYFMLICYQNWLRYCLFMFMLFTFPTIYTQIYLCYFFLVSPPAPSVLQIPTSTSFSQQICFIMSAMVQKQTMQVTNQKICMTESKKYLMASDCLQNGYMTIIYIVPGIDYNILAYSKQYLFDYGEYTCTLFCMRQMPIREYCSMYVDSCYLDSLDILSASYSFLGNSIRYYTGTYFYIPNYYDVDIVSRVCAIHPLSNYTNPVYYMVMTLLMADGYMPYWDMDCLRVYFTFTSLLHTQYISYFNYSSDTLTLVYCSMQFVIVGMSCQIVQLMLLLLFDSPLYSQSLPISWNLPISLSPFNILLGFNIILTTSPMVQPILRISIYSIPSYLLPICCIDYDGNMPIYFYLFMSSTSNIQSLLFLFVLAIWMGISHLGLTSTIIYLWEDDHCFSQLMFTSGILKGISTVSTVSTVSVGSYYMILAQSYPFYYPFIGGILFGIPY